MRALFQPTATSAQRLQHRIEPGAGQPEGPLQTGNGLIRTGGTRG